jgi:hypothetical protein
MTKRMAKSQIKHLNSMGKNGQKASSGTCYMPLKMPFQVLELFNWLFIN